MAAQKHRLDRRWQLRRSNAADTEDCVFRQQIDHELEGFCRIRHCALKTAMHVEHHVDEWRVVVQSFGDERGHVLHDVGRAEDFPFRLDTARLHRGGQFAILGRRAVEHDLLAVEDQVDRGGVERAHFGAGVDTLDALLPQGFPLTVGHLLDHVAVNAAASRVVDDDVGSCANTRIDFAVDLRVARRLIVWTACVDRHHGRTGVPAVDHVTRDLLRLCWQIRVLLLAGHSASGRDGDDNFVRTHWVFLQGCRGCQ